jgi:Tol biopolymer transport system component
MKRVGWMPILLATAWIACQEQSDLLDPTGTEDEAQLATSTETDAVSPLQHRAQEIIQEVEVLVADGALDAGNGNALTSILESVLKSIANDRPNTIVLLGAFTNMVEGFIRGGVLASESGQPLIEDAELIVVYLRGHHILFASSVDGSSDVWGINIDGSGRVNLSEVSHDPDSQFEDGGGRWSPDGTRILFTSDKFSGVPRKVFIMNADGSNAHPLNDNTNTEVDPFWAADGTKVYYGRNTLYPSTTGAGCAPCPYWEIHEYDLTTGQETRLTYNNYRDEHAVASPDGNCIAFRRAEYANDCCNPTSIWIMDADGQNQHRITPNNWQYETPYDWDLATGKILSHWTPNSAVVLLDPDGTAEQLTTGAYGIAFSPDGSKILLGRDGDIHFLDIATREITPFLVEPGGQYPTDWLVGVE